MKHMTIGTFDGFHAGHANLLQTLININPTATLIIGVNSDEFTQSYKRTPKLNETQRVNNVKQWLTEHDQPHKVFINKGFNHQPQHILDYTPQLFAVGVDWADSNEYGKQLYLNSPAEEWFKNHGIQLIYLPRLAGVSSTQLIQEGKL